MSPAHPNPARILLLDDDPFMLKLLARMLAQQGYTQVDAFDCGRKALDQIAASQAAYDLILLDIQMPEMDGVEFIRHLAACHYGGSIILVSGEAGRILESIEKLIASHQLHALGHLQKPIRAADLASALARLQPGSGRGDAAAIAKPHYTAAQLRAAIDNGELVNFYQPKVAMATGEVVGMECLVRWQHPTQGLICPDQFVESAAECGLITDVTRVVLGSAFAQARAWLQAGRDFSVAVNVTMEDLETLDFPDIVAGLARSAGVSPNLITLEVTEGQMMRNRSSVLDVLTRLELKRFRLAIDDFGTGHSSLAQLRDLPFDELKIDRSFVHGACGDETRRAICSASLRMGHQLKLQVVGEGIENAEDWQFLRDLGCDVGQGYFISRPLPARDVAGWIDAWSARLGTVVPAKA